jgi:hypothetical protein
MQQMCPQRDDLIARPKATGYAGCIVPQAEHLDGLP